MGAVTSTVGSPPNPRRAARLVPLATGLVLALRWLVRPRGFDELGLAAVRDAALSIVLVILVGVLAAGIGARLLRWMRLRQPPSALFWLLAETLGLGALAYVGLALGLLGGLNAAAISAALLLLSFLAAEASAEAVLWCAGVPRAAQRLWAQAGLLPRATLLFAGAIFLLAFVQALTPPWDYDGLMYHLVGPRLFLEAQRIYAVPDNWYVNGPFTVEMLFTIGMSRGDDVFPKLIHMLFGLLLVAATWSAGRRWLGGDHGWLAAAILLGLPTLPVWASFAYIDLAWALFEFLALVCVLEWEHERQGAWLVLGGVLLGLAMGSKYLAVEGLALLGLAAVWFARRDGWRRMLLAGATLGLPAALVASPWYLKNLIVFGNPVYPLYFGGPGWTAERLANYMGYLNGFGMGKSFLDLIRLPWDVYAHHAVFGTVMNLIDMPNLLFLLLFALPLLRKPARITTLVLLCAARVGLWFAGSQQLRFLMPIMPALAIATAYAVVEIGRLQRERNLPLRPLLPAMAVAFMVITLFYQGVMLRQFRPLPVVVGIESRRGFLSRMVKDFDAGRLAVEQLPAGTRLLQLGDGRSYYCLPACLPDPDHYRWSAEIASHASIQDTLRWMDGLGITHVLLSIEDLDFLIQHDQGGVMRTAYGRLLTLRELGCLHEILRDEWIALYEVGCPAAGTSADAPVAQRLQAAVPQ